VRQGRRRGSGSPATHCFGVQCLPTPSWLCSCVDDSLGRAQVSPTPDAGRSAAAGSSEPNAWTPRCPPPLAALGDAAVPPRQRGCRPQLRRAADVARAGPHLRGHPAARQPLCPCSPRPAHPMPRTRSAGPAARQGRDPGAPPRADPSPRRLIRLCRSLMEKPKGSNSIETELSRVSRRTETKL
jgi:hypothetical protein